jgi:hypothetical protein
MPLMASALFGNKSIVSSEIFRYVFPHANVSYVDESYCSGSNLEHNLSESTSSKNDTNEYAHSCLDAVMAAVSKDDEHNETCGGTNTYKTAEDQVVFLTQAESYCYCGPAFDNYSRLEFESIFQFQDRATFSKNTKNDRGQKPQPTFLLGVNHPLYSSHVGVIRMKMCTPMLAGTPPPKFPGNQLIDDESRIHTWDIEMRYYSKYLIDLFVPWSDESRLLFERSAIGFSTLVNTWNRKSVTFIERQ